MRHFEPEINGHEVSAKAVQFSPTIMIDEGKPLVQKYEDSYKQAEYAYSLIESEV